MANGLWNAVKDCHFQHLKFLVDSGLSVNQRNTNGQHTLIAALNIEDDEKRLRMFRYLLSRKADFRAFDRTTGRDILMWAVFLNKQAEAEITMLELAGDINFHKKDKYGRTIVHYATMRGNTDLLQSIVTQMKKFDVSVDIPDNEGFTPYMLAKRLGYDACAEILLTEGEASPHIFDKNRKTIFQWADEGQKEQLDHLNDDKDKKISTYKLLGRLPALREAQFEVSQVQIVPSYKDKQLLDNAIKERKQIDDTHVKDFGRIAARRNLSKSMSKLDEIVKESATSSQMRRLSVTSNTSTKSLDDAIRWLNIKHDPEELNKKFLRKRAISTSIPELMTILEQQSTASYRSVAKVNVVEEEIKEAEKLREGMKSTMAIIFGKDGRKKVITKDEKNQKNKLSTIQEIRSGRNSMITRNKLH